MKATTRPEPDILSLLENGFNEETAKGEGAVVSDFAGRVLAAIERLKRKILMLQ
jgi:hypothetical protein